MDRTLRRGLHTPNANVHGPDSFTFAAGDGTPARRGFAGTDLDGDTLAVAIDGAPAHGSLGALTRLNATGFTAWYTGADVLTFHVKARLPL